MKALQILSNPALKSKGSKVTAVTAFTAVAVSLYITLLYPNKVRISPFSTMTDLEYSLSYLSPLLLSNHQELKTYLRPILGYLC